MSDTTVTESLLEDAKGAVQTSHALVLDAKRALKNAMDSAIVKLNQLHEDIAVVQSMAFRAEDDIISLVKGFEDDVILTVDRVGAEAEVEVVTVWGVLKKMFTS